MASRKIRLTCEYRSVFGQSVHRRVPERLSFYLLKPQGVDSGHVAKYLSQELWWKFLTYICHHGRQGVWRSCEW